MIQTFKDKRIEQVYNGTLPRGFPQDTFRRAVVKLDQLHSASSLNDLKIPTSNRLESLSGAKNGQHSIRINQQWRICFIWRDAQAYQVEILDYH